MITRNSCVLESYTKVYLGMEKHCVTHNVPLYAGAHVCSHTPIMVFPPISTPLSLSFPPPPLSLSPPPTHPPSLSLSPSLTFSPSQTGGRLLQEGMEDNHTVVNFDLRLTDISQESEYCINQIVKANLDRKNVQNT